MAKDPEEMERMAAELEASGRYRVLRRLDPVSHYDVSDGAALRRGIFLDVETTGLDPRTDEVIELAMVSFDYGLDGRIFSISESFSRFRDPGRPIPAEVVALTGITDEMVAGQSITAGEIEAFLGGTVVVVAHNAAFDRRFAERLCGAFANLAWACSWREIPWAQEGFAEGARLTHLAAAFGFFYDRHRAEHDCRAGIELMSRPLPRSQRRGLDLLLESARTPCWRLRAVGAPFEMREALKKRGYRWDAGDSGRQKAWWIDVSGNTLDAERAYLSREIYGRDDVDIEALPVDAFNRYSERC